MGVLKRKEERTEVLTIRVPGSVKSEIDRLRERASEAGFDLNATICESIVRLTRQIRDEIDLVQRKPDGGEAAEKTARRNGQSHSEGTVRAAESNGARGVI